MVFVKNVRYCEAECGEHITDFAKELVGYRKESVCDVIAKFGDVYIEVTSATTAEDIIDHFQKCMKEGNF